jgi:hypothetical protein
MRRPPAARVARAPRSAHRASDGVRALIAGVEIILLAACLVAGNIVLVRALDNVLDVIHESVPAAYHAWAASCWTYSCKIGQDSPEPPTRAAAS